MAGLGKQRTLPLWFEQRGAVLGDDPLVIVRDGPVAHLVINRPSRRNAVTADVWRDLAASAERLSADPEVRLVALRGAGRHAFSAGADIEEFPEVYATPETATLYNRLVREGQEAIERLERPTLAVIHGACVGGGCGLALACDLRFASRDALFGITPSRLGLAYSPADTRRLVALVGPARAKDMLFSGRLLHADEAGAIGLVDRVVAPAELEASAAEYARTLIANSLQSIQVAKTIVNAATGAIDMAAEVQQALFEETFISDDFREGYTAFRERRRADFS